jgi:hypothetical protein
MYPVNIDPIVADQKAESLQWSCEEHSKLATTLMSRITTEHHSRRSGTW